MILIGTHINSKKEMDFVADWIAAAAYIHNFAMDFDDYPLYNISDPTISSTDDDDNDSNNDTDEDPFYDDEDMEEDGEYVRYCLYEELLVRNIISE